MFYLFRCLSAAISQILCGFFKHKYACFCTCTSPNIQGVYFLSINHNGLKCASTDNIKKIIISLNCEHLRVMWMISGVCIQAISTIRNVHRHFFKRFRNASERSQRSYKCAWT